MKNSCIASIDCLKKPQSVFVSFYAVAKKSKRLALAQTAIDAFFIITMSIHKINSTIFFVK
jgi:hypothetical protein